MSKKLLEIQSSELKFMFELEKRCSCTVHLVNNTDEYVAFKVKTTSPSKYSVLPSISVVCPKTQCELTVILEAQHVAPADMKCKDKFLIQSTTVSIGTTEEEITSTLFRKNTGRYIDESKLRVVLISPPHSPVSHHEVLKQVTKELKVAQDVEDRKVAEAGEDFTLTKDIKELKLRVKTMESKLNKAEVTITMLREGRSIATKERQTLKQELAMSETDSDSKEIEVGFCFLFLFIVAIALGFGY
ncbi:vesicle-associated protein 1-2-like [Thalictrum thalictroides]|uniref:Vesicle-associated protein 1-2-like n=1 Tax=Thalictrum thalictroides TaxID=46969 RepID=A0A7J6V7H5_THATH|nr:vesicle-associated protein 1-2-like [Thalictrum thalictroides]